MSFNDLAESARQMHQDVQAQRKHRQYINSQVPNLIKELRDTFDAAVKAINAKAPDVSAQHEISSADGGLVHLLSGTLVYDLNKFGYLTCTFKPAPDSSPEIVTYEARQHDIMPDSNGRQITSMVWTTEDTYTKTKLPTEQLVAKVLQHLLDLQKKIKI